MRVKTVALTGGTGFVGKTLIRLALADGLQVRALARSPQEPMPGVAWIRGAALRDLAKGSDAIIHAAGVVNAPDRAAFEAGNVAGTLAMIEACKAAGVERFIHVSSLAAREPQLSDYGWSKAKSESIVTASGLDWTIVRPSGVYGPGDTEMLDMFKIARSGWLIMPPAGHLSVIEVSDLARLLLAVVPYADSRAQTYEADDGEIGGWTSLSFAKAIGWAVDKRVTVVHTPAALLRGLARLDKFTRRSKAKLTVDRAAYLCHPDWTVDPAKRPPAKLWEPQIRTRAGLKATARAYRAAGWMS
jgi:nucleoside-diphosphate-sugar epimerase